jgi:hypothetical protein
MPSISFVFSLATLQIQKDVFVTSTPVSSRCASRLPKPAEMFEKEKVPKVLKEKKVTKTVLELEKSEVWENKKLSEVFAEKENSPPPRETTTTPLKKSVFKDNLLGFLGLKPEDKKNEEIEQSPDVLDATEDSFDRMCK